MKCTKCENGTLKVTHTHTPSPGMKIQRAKCGTCKRIFTIVSRIEFENPVNGQGAYALAKAKSKRSK